MEEKKEGWGDRNRSVKEDISESLEEHRGGLTGGGKSTHSSEEGVTNKTQMMKRV